MEEVGSLQRDDPLYNWMVNDVYPVIGLNIKNPEIKVYHVKASHKVYLYETWKEGKSYRVIGKFYGNEPNAERRFQLELDHYSELGKMGMVDGAYRISRLLGHNRDIDLVLVIEYASGRLLDSIILSAIYRGKRDRLHSALSDLAYFLYLLHSRSVGSHKTDFNMEKHYFYETIRKLQETTSLRDEEKTYFQRLVERWADRGEMWETPAVYVHGDCTPSNFSLSDNPRLIAFDLERCKWSDPVFDTGRVAGELKHRFILETGDGDKAEPFIRHFYEDYCKHFNSPDLFMEITARNPFYQAVTELRIAKNPWLNLEHRKRLIHEAKICLETGAH